jgi:hypothetical protein
MAGTSNYLQNNLIDFVLRAQTFSPAATLYVGLLTCSQGTKQTSTSYTSGDTVSIIASDGKNHLYKCTTTGTTAGTSPTYPGVPDEVITDNTAVFTEQTSVLEAAGATLVEVSGGSYARVAITSGLTEWAGTQGSGTTAASSGASATTSNNSDITFPTATADWAASPVEVWGIGIWDASTAGNLYFFGGLSSSSLIASGNITKILAGSLTLAVDKT